MIAVVCPPIFFTNHPDSQYCEKGSEGSSNVPNFFVFALTLSLYANFRNFHKKSHWTQAVKCLKV